jgi:hypothetical protein
MEKLTRAAIIKLFGKTAGEKLYVFLYKGCINACSIQLKNLPIYDDDADAALGGLTSGDFYQTSGGGAAPLNVAGILMIKQ